MQEFQLIQHLFRTEYRKTVAVLCRLFGIDHIEIAEDIVSDTFLAAAEVWGLKGMPENPTAWIYAVAKNKTKDYLKRNALFAREISKNLQYEAVLSEETELDLSVKNINDSQLAMIFVVCHPCNGAEAQVGLALNLLCGFNVDEVASALLKSRESVYKMLQRAKQKLRLEKVVIGQIIAAELSSRLPAVLMTLYLLFNEGYYSSGQTVTLRKDLCAEAMRLTYLLIENEQTNHPFANALFSLMSFHSSRFDARLDQKGEIILYYDQDIRLWNQDLIRQGEFYLNQASGGNTLSKYHLEAAIAYWHTSRDDSKEKWNNILQLYNELLIIEYSPIAALNRTYALAKANSKEEAIAEAEKINLPESHLYQILLGELYLATDTARARTHFQKALLLAKSASDQLFISKKIADSNL